MATFLGNSCPLGWPCVIVFVFVIFIYFPYGFKSGVGFLIAPVPVRCFSITFTDTHARFLVPVKKFFEGFYHECLLTPSWSFDLHHFKKLSFHPVHGYYTLNLALVGKAFSYEIFENGRRWTDRRMPDHEFTKRSQCEPPVQVG